MPIEPNQLLLHYRLLAKIGEGGMGVVWKALDTTLDREVAIKILPAAFAADPERLARFDREARVLASLNHTGIAAIYGLHEHRTGPDSIRFLAMELVPGEELAERLNRGPLAIPDALTIAAQIAEALETAHDQGIIHRDLKPANVKLTPDGKVKVLDFGLAKALADDTASAGGDPSHSPTITSAGTVVGMILGTAAYMSPEQAKGLVVDRRADIWSFGVVLHEMLTGRRTFAGETVSETLASVIKDEIDYSVLPPDTPRHVRRLLRRCLDRDPHTRLRDAGEARVALTSKIDEADVAQAETGAATNAASNPPRWILPLAAGALILGAVIGFVGYQALDTPPPAPAVDRTSIVERGLITSNSTPIAPDGRAVAMIVEGEGGLMLAVRSLDRFDPVVLTGTEGALNPFFSPDGEWIGYFTRSSLMKVQVRGGTPRTICEIRGLVRFDPWNSGDYSTADWHANGSIVFSSGYWRALADKPGLYVVSAAGGKPRPITQLAGKSISHENPSFTPDGDHVLFTMRYPGVEDDRLEVVDTASGARRVVMEGVTTGRIMEAGYLLYQDQFYNRLGAAPVDLSSFEVLGPGVPLIEGFTQDTTLGYSVSPDGDLLYMPAAHREGNRRIVRIGLDGSMTTLVARAGSWLQPRISPDGRRLLVREVGAVCRLWLYDLEREVMTPLTDEGMDAHTPMWSRDGRWILFAGLPTDASRRRVYRVLADGSRAPELIPYTGQTSEVHFPRSFSPGDTEILFEQSTLDHGVDLLVQSADGSDMRPFLATEADETSGRFSPDGNWVAYTSDTSGRLEVYVRAYPGAGSLIQVSQDGGDGPVWSPDGATIYYTRGRDYMAAPFNVESGAPAVSAARVLFRVDGSVTGEGDAFYDLAPDGEAFVVVEPLETGARELRLIRGWVGELEELVPHPR